MAGSNRRFALAIALPLLLLALPRLTGAATITVDTTSAGHVAGECTLEDAVKSANNQAAPSGSSCTAGSSNNDTIEFSVTGTIGITATLNITDAQLAINGFAGSPGITISGGNTNEIVMVGATNLTLENLTLAEGFVGGPPTAYGGAIFESMTNLEIENCTFIDNTAGGASAAGAGGAIFMNSGTVTIINSTFANNTAQSGAPLIMGVPSAGDGGAIFNDTGTLTTTNTTFSGNDAGVGAVISILSVFMHPAITSMRSTLLANSKGGGGNCDTSFGTVTDDGYNISDDDTCGFTMAPTGTSINNSTTLNLDPAGLQNNGGPTQTIALEDDSEAVHFIPVLDCTDQESPPMQLTTDQRGFPRPDPGNPNFCDAGAFELQTTPIVISASGERLQIVHSSTPSGNLLNTSFTFTELGFPACDAGDDPFNGIDVAIEPGSCAASGPDAIGFFLNSWAVQTVNHQIYGTLSSIDPPENLTVRMVELPTPAAPACGEWTINLEFTGVDLTPLGDGPFALILRNPDGDAGCFDITNAIVGNQIVPPTRTVRRGVRK
jgi:hypothetical protein